jgi:hypothetical protein
VRSRHLVVEVIREACTNRSHRAMDRRRFEFRRPLVRPGLEDCLAGSLAETRAPADPEAP